MHLILPPSESKRPGGGGLFTAGSLSHAAQLGGTRTRVAAALVSLSADEPAAVKQLKLGAKNRDERLHNLALETSGTMAAIARYTGVLYDALDVESLAPNALAWVREHVSIQSALFGLISAADMIPSYRLSASSRLPGLGASLKRVWAEAHEPVMSRESRWTLDLRSQDYAALAPLPPDLGDKLHVAQRGDDGHVRALNHFNKAAKGDLVRRLAESGAQIADRADFLAWADDRGLKVQDSGHGELTLVTELGAPAVASRR